MIGHCTPVIGRTFLHSRATDNLLDRLTLAKAVGIVWRVAGAHGKGIRRIRRVQMLLTEIDIIQRVRLTGTAIGLAGGIGSHCTGREQCRTQDRQGQCASPELCVGSHSPDPHSPGPDELGASCFSDPSDRQPASHFHIRNLFDRYQNFTHSKPGYNVATCPQNHHRGDSGKACCQKRGAPQRPSPVPVSRQRNGTTGSVPTLSS